MTFPVFYARKINSLALRIVGICTRFCIRGKPLNEAFRFDAPSEDTLMQAHPAIIIFPCVASTALHSFD